MRSSLFQLIAQCWSLPLVPTLGVLVTAAFYVRGFRRARRTRRRELPWWRAACFLAGLLTVWLALASPVDALDPFLLVAHMTQHLLLMSLAPPLLLLGSPIVPLLRGLPRGLVREDLAPWMNSRAFRFLQRMFTHPAFGWLGMTLAIIFWHLPAAYELALRSEAWHQVEHGCFFFTALSFWWFVIRPWPSHIRGTRWWIVPYVITAHLVLLAVATVLALAGWVIYPSYAAMPRLFGISALTDQGVAGGEMVFVGLLAVVGTLFPLIIELLSEEDAGPAREKAAVRLQALPVLSGDSSRLKWRYVRPVLSIAAVVLVCALAVASLQGDPDDEARLRFRQPAGPYVLSLFTAPEPVADGETHLSVAVERPQGKGLVEDANVELTLVPIGGGEPTVVQATHAEGTPKFLQGASVAIPRSGDWRVQVVARRGREVATSSTGLKVLPEGAGGHGWDFAAIGLVLFLFALHEWRRLSYQRGRRRRARRACQANPATAA